MIFTTYLNFTIHPNCNYEVALANISFTSNFNVHLGSLQISNPLEKEIKNQIIEHQYFGDKKSQILRSLPIRIN